MMKQLIALQRTYRNKSLGTIFLLLQLLGGTVCAQSYRNRDLGDSAFKNSDYVQAIKFYQRYRDQAANDKKALADAYSRLTASYIRASDAENATACLQNFKKLFPTAKPVRKALYKADIAVLQQHYAVAEKELRTTLKHFPKVKEPLRNQLLSSLGFSLVQQKKWREAFDVYQKLEKFGGSANWKFIGFRQKLYCLIMGEQLQESHKLFANANRFAEQESFYDIQLLSLLQLLKQNDIAALATRYDNVMKQVPNGPDALAYKIARSVTDYYFEKKEYAKAGPYLRDAFKFATSELARKNDLRELINVYASADLKKEAIKAALKYIEFYYNDPQTVQVQLECAALMAEEKLYRDALGVYVALVHRRTLSPELKIRAAREAAKVFELTGSKTKAAKMLMMICEFSPDEQSRLEGWYFFGKFYYRQGDYLKAVESFDKVIKGNSKWKWSAMYWKMHSLLGLKQYQDALAMASDLRANSVSPEIAARAAYYHAVALENSGEVEKAISGFISFADEYPKSDYASGALLEAGRLAMQQALYTKAAGFYESYAKRYPKDKFVALALYKAAYANYLAQNYEQLQVLVDKLLNTYQESSYTPAAQLWLVDCWRNNGNYKEALTYLETMQKLYATNPDVLSQVLYDTALVYYRQQNYTQAMELLNELFNKFSSRAIIADAYFLAGDVSSKDGNFTEAANYYSHAAKLRPKSQFEIACLGRVADCNYTEYGRSFDKQKLEEAAAIYKRLLATDTVEGVIKNQTMYKLGRCYELLEQDDKALDMYNELLYSYNSKTRVNDKLEPVWVVKAAYAAVTIYLKYNTPAAAKEAVRVYRILKKMDLNTGEDFDRFIRNIKNKYSL